MKEQFLWGVATSAFQLEGSPFADWSSWDEVLKYSPRITNHYEMYMSDIRLLKELGVNAHRFSIEWSRIQPQEKLWDESALEHYQKLIDALRANNIEPMLTLHHFTHPRWFLEKYPWHTEHSAEKFMRFAEKAVSKIKGVRYWITINEPYIFLLGGYLEGCMPPGLKDPALALVALKNLLITHASAYDLIHGICPGAMVSVAHNMAPISPWNKWNPLDRLLSRIGSFFYNHSLIDAFSTGILRIKFPFRKAIEIEVPVKGKLDFFGVNYYTRAHLRFNLFRKMGVELRHKDLEGNGLSDLGWEIHPEGLEKVIKYASRLGVPLIITENGIATRDNFKKMEFINNHIIVVEKCINAGYDIKGYFYWSLMDNYEWLQGLDSRFGLYRVDFETLERRPTMAASFYSYLVKSTSFNRNLIKPK